MLNRMVMSHVAGEVNQGFMCPGKEFWLYPEGNGDILEGVKQENYVIKMEP